MKMNKTVVIQLISCIYAFLLTLILVGLFIGSGIGLGLLNNRSVLHSLDESKYYNKIYEVLYNRASRDIEEAGFPPSVLEEAITLERVYITGRSYYDAILNTKAALLKTDRLKKALEDNLRQYLKAKGAEPDKLDTSLEQLIHTIEQDYIDAIKLPVLAIIAEYRTNYLKVLLYLVPLMLLLAILICYLLLRMYRNRYIHRGVRYITYAMISSSILVAAMAGYLLLTKPYNGILTQPEYYQSFMNSYLHGSITIFIYIGGMGLILSLALLSVGSCLKNRMNLYAIDT